MVAGQTVPHLHVHLIPRYEGDVPDPRGGVRWVVPGKANYLGVRCTALGGLSVTPTSKAIEARLCGTDEGCGSCG